jgi:glycerate 2-kinase
VALSFPAQRAVLRGLFDAAVAAADPAHCLSAWLPGPPLGAPWWSAPARRRPPWRAVEDHWRGDAERLSGIVVTRYGHGVPTRRIEVVEASHPAPDAAGQQAAVRILDAVKGLTADDLVLVLLSGGGSALLAAPMAGITLEQKRAVTKALLACGASIGEINCVRKHLSAIKGGRLALAAAPARVLTLAISDVPGDDCPPSPPAPPCPTRPLRRCPGNRRSLRHRPSARARELLLAAAPARHRRPATPVRPLRGAGDRHGASRCWPRRPLRPAQGITPLVLGDAIEGEAREVARVLGGIALSCADHGVPLAGPCVLLSGGETTVTVRGRGRGGRNAEFLLGLALALERPSAHPCHRR